ncbi:hypothetical protein F4821DRAFT_265394 [Hypoxylon rubiginosum]|uniref:Uncharacterized protein n=1 Tax=Hypoxylon rubiginosum TaxID=110542 RepID=A0ACC0CKL9_9PEZI|nr:hypothetical protein F4821DRAFT_265394 [Hypoxylon rubiginosum]
MPVVVFSRLASPGAVANMGAAVLETNSVAKGTCNATAECGEYALPENFDCPLNVCCSKHGFCGYTPEFCNDECQNEGGCPDVPRPKCGANTDAMAAEVRIAYYGAWSASRSCDALQPENIPAGVLTHINVAFEYVTDDHEITEESGAVVGRVSRLKNIYPGLRVNIALGGWTFNDPPTQRRFSEMVASVSARKTFIKSLIRYIQKYALDGVDLDWEYPVTDDRGGVPEDFDNLVLLCAEIREAFDSYDPGWQLTITLPMSYWYLRGFNVKNLEKYVDWFNVMTYDIHGIWDQGNIWTGAFLKGHTNLTEIEDGFDLLWRNSISSDKVVMGYGFYGRGFTMSDPQCSKPPSCMFDGPSFAGDCTGEPGILSYSEVIGMSKELGAKISYDEASSVKWMVYGANQWISWDDAESFEAKKKYMFSRCLKGLMIWELGLDTGDYQALTGLFGEDAVSDALSDASLNPEEKKKLTLDLSAYNGQFCYVTETCVGGDEDTDDEKGRCMAGYSVAETAHAPLKMESGAEKCKKGSYHRICCPTKAMPKNCEWLGAPELNGFWCDGGCGESQFELATDTYLDRAGEGSCFFGHRSLCCDSTAILQKCHWTDCDWNDGDNGNCAEDEVSVATRTRIDNDDGDMCKTQVGMGNGGPDGPTTHQHFRSYCCPKNDALEDCKWANDPSGFDPDLQIWGRTALTCVQKDCSDTALAITSATEPSTIYDLQQDMGSDVCEVWAPPSSKNSVPYDLCCSPPSRFTDEWPVDPNYLWDNAWTGEDDDVSWQWSNNFGNNNEDTSPINLEDNPGGDPYGFVMLDGPPGSIAGQFDRQFTVLTRDEPLNIKPRSFVTTNTTILDATFDHTEETVHVYCNFPHDSKHCTDVFIGGARDTIIKLPTHVGEGPWARIVSMEPDYDPPELPAWAIRKRSAGAVHRNGIYKLTFDYDFHLIERADEDPVYMRIDYTNLQDYWDSVTDEDPKNNKRKRSASSGTDFNSWKAHVDKAKRGAYTDFSFNGASNTDFSPRGPVHPSPYSETRSSVLSERSSDIERRWWGTFVNWLKKVTTITSEQSGNLPMGLSKIFNIYSGRLRCENSAGVTITAGLDVTADVRLDMGVKYAYYFSGTVVPPNIIDTYVFVGAQPNVYAGITIRGDAELSYQSEVRKLIQTIAYPGLSIKGIATVGPSLDLWGRIEGRITVSGQLKVGAKYTFSPVEMYLPNDEETHDRASDQLEDFGKDEQGIAPVFQANVQAEVDAHLRVTPEINCGIKVGGGIGPLKDPFLDGHVSAFMNTSLHFNAHVTGDTDGQTSNWEYGYKVELLWRIGLTAIAQIYNYKRWQSGTYFPVDWQTIPIYGPIVVHSTSSGSKRQELGGSEPWHLTDQPLPDPIFGWRRSSLGATSQPILEGRAMIGANYSWAGAGDWVNSSIPAIGRRQANTEVEFPTDPWTDFKCTTGPNTSPCNTANTNNKRDLAPYSPAGGSLLRRVVQKRAVNDCRQKIPLLYYNCATFFSDVTLQGAAGNLVTLPGICTSIRKFLGNNGIISDKYLLTYDSYNQDTRRRQTCTGSRNPCAGPSGENALRKAQLGAPFDGAKNLVNCDEFPFASTEEGGYGWARSDAGIFPANTHGVTRTCVPEWQNTLQGNCNGLLNSIETNVEYFNNAENPTGNDPEKASFQSWNSNAWNTKGSWTKGGDPGRQRLSLYDTDQPLTYSPIPQELANRKLSWFHKRNFTLHLVNNGPSTPAQFPENAFASGTLVAGDYPPATTVVGNAAWIMCAVSLRGQERFKWTVNADGSRRHNGYCWDGQSQTAAWGGAGNFQRLRYFSCDIDFVGAPHATPKRGLEPMGYFGDEPVYSVKRAANYHEIDIKVPLNEAPLPDVHNAFPISW